MISMLENESGKQYISDNVLFSADVRNILGVSRQTISNMVDDGRLIPIKRNSTSMLFFKPDVLALKEQSRQIVEANSKRYISTETATDYSVEEFLTVAPLDDIVSVKLYFNRIDAIYNGYYLLYEGTKIYKNQYQDVNAPTFVATTKDQTEYWFFGMNCGYNGTGPRGTEKILKELEVPKDKIDLLFNSSQITYHREKDGWSIGAQVQKIYKDANENCLKTQKSYNDIEDNRFFYLRTGAYNNNPVTVLQPRDILMPTMDVQIEEVLEDLFFYFGNVAQVLIYDKDEAKASGHIMHQQYNPYFSQTYQVILQNASGYEIWLPYAVDDKKPLYKQPNITEILCACGIDISKKEIHSNKVKTFLKMRPRVEIFTKNGL